MRYGSDHKAATRRKVLRAAAAALRVGGPDRVGVATVMRHAGLTHGGFYAHFASRDDLLAGAVDYMFERPRAVFRADVDAADPRAGLRQLIDRYLSLRHCDSLLAGCPIPILAGVVHRLPAVARAPVAAATARMIAGITTLLDRAGIPDSRLKAQTAFAEMVGTINLARLQIDRPAAEVLLENARRSVAGKFDLI